MKQIIFASTNQGKINEIKQALPNFEILSLNDFPNVNDVDEPFFTYIENAKHKAKSFFDQTGIPVLAEDSGIEIDHLSQHPQTVDWKPNMTVPGVFSARYASLVLNNPILDHDTVANNTLVMMSLEGIENRNAKYVSNFVFYDGTDFILSYGEMKGIITEGHERGHNGFAYDTIFQPKTSDKMISTSTYAQMPNHMKNSLSHRVKALNAMVNKLS